MCIWIIGHFISKTPGRQLKGPYFTQASVWTKALSKLYWHLLKCHSAQVCNCWTPILVGELIVTLNKLLAGFSSHFKLVEMLYADLDESADCHFKAALTPEHNDLLALWFGNFWAFFTSELQAFYIFRHFCLAQWKALGGRGNWGWRAAVWAEKVQQNAQVRRFYWSLRPKSLCTFFERRAFCFGQQNAQMETGAIEMNRIRFVERFRATSFRQKIAHVWSMGPKQAAKQAKAQIEACWKPGEAC